MSSQPIKSPTSSVQTEDIPKDLRDTFNVLDNTVSDHGLAALRRAVRAINSGGFDVQSFLITISYKAPPA